ncbi:hypothetical protein [Streptomyces sp. NBC_01314]|uniref:hypothetical protein n=1 Tax=Streptomyces sp. NBC_01314 TaxID=2903821 RepID=UPI003087C14E|nr:hypothetical protein OG622_10055 [Streptomyces sp. NBC_01314]
MRDLGTATTDRIRSGGRFATRWEVTPASGTDQGRLTSPPAGAVVTYAAQARAKT